MTLASQKIVDAPHQALERIPLHGLAEVTVRPELVADHNIRFRLRGGQNHGRDGFQIYPLDAGPEAAAIHSREVEVQQDQVRARSIGVFLSCRRNARASAPS